MNSDAAIKHSDRPKISIGMPLYNAEAFLRKRLDSILSQSFTDFELIISDDASTDSTALICNEYLKKDKRIRYFHQEKNMGITWNFNFVLQEAKSKYFMWAAADDIISHDFLEKNIIILESKKNVVASISKIEQYGETCNNLQVNKIDSEFRGLIKKLRKSFKHMGVYPISGSYEKKVRFYLRKSTCKIIHSVYRTDILQQCIIHKPFLGNDWAIILSVLKYGDFDVVNETLMYEFEDGVSATGSINISRKYHHGFLGIIFPWYPLTVWCIRNLGMNIFLKNFDFFIRLNFEGMISFSLDIIRLLFHKLMNK
ncbi:MAG: glycosyltransferase family 2 protein [Nitrosotalea sp.]